MYRRHTSYDPEEAEPLYETHIRRNPETQPWDVFQDPPIQKEVGSTAGSEWIDKSIKVLKIFTYILTFVIVLGCAVISKGTFLLATSQLSINNTKPYCNKDLGVQQQFVVTTPRVERVLWTWIVIFIYFVPELGTFIRSVRICAFKKWRAPSTLDFVSLLITETLPAIGSAILAFAVLPELDVIKGAMLTNAVCLVPACLALLSRNPTKSKNQTKMVLDVMCIVAQASALVVWPLIEEDANLFAIPVSVILISFGWWENYVSVKSSIPYICRLGKIKRKFDNSRYFSYIIISVWKCFVFLGITLLIIAIKENDVNYLFEDFDEAFRDHYVNITEIKPVIGEILPPEINDIIQSTGMVPKLTNFMTPIWVLIINVLASYLCYAFGKFACKIMIQEFSYAFANNLSVPVTISGLIGMCGAYINDECAFYDVIPGYLFFNTPPVYYLNDFITHQHAWIWLLWLLSQMWITVHIWNPKCERLARTEKLFVRPMYDAFLIDQSIAMNRRRDDSADIDDEDDVEIESDISEERNCSKDDKLTRIYACGTMWHEEREEMIPFLKSILRMDEDQCARRLARDAMHYNIPDYYEYETHIFFDDAFVRKHKKDNDPLANKYVSEMISVLDDAATEVHKTKIRIRPPTLYPTPYGGRLVWTLPGKTKMIVHLKDKAKIRVKKRWSQVMYMYYLLGHKLMENPHLSDQSKETIAKNTFILALDGDIDFQPRAVLLLVDLMKKNKSVGAACGRIHPIGMGPMVWYQMFEYAVGHWLQKATEHVIGCVLCSPGCFSLFRGHALMDKNVMKKYTTTSVEPLHYVQYDQGEDRWLCTLLLQRGHRVEYSAASDAYTHCPESFNIFYNQRRRWIPSTIANILDLLTDYKRTVKMNNSISRLYIGYQIILMVGTILGPGTIFLMLVGAFVAAFQLDQWSSFVWNVVPILIFMFVCFMFKSEDVQLIFAGVISAIYGLVMMAVLVGVMLQIESDGFLAPSSLFFFCVAGQMIITALLHPQELDCLKHGIVYYVTVPSMYMLLIIYCVFNMNNVSWGTRDVTVVEKPEEDEDSDEEDNKPKEPEKKEKQNKIFSLFGDKNEDDAGAVEFSFSGLFKCFLCTHRAVKAEDEQLLKIQNSVDLVMKKLEALEKQQHAPLPEPFEQTRTRRRTTILEGSRASRNSAQPNELIIDSSSDYSQFTATEEIEPNSWLYDGVFARSEVCDLSTEERTFWEKFIQKYLQPINDTKKKKQIVGKQLKDLRDKAVFAFVMLNSIFVLVIFLLTLKKDTLHVKWPLGIKSNFTYLDDKHEIRLYKSYLELEPIGFVFLLFFALLLVIQFTAMLIHRFGTFSQILATTILNFSLVKTSSEHLTEEERIAKDPVGVAKQMQKLQGLDDNDEQEKDEEGPERRKTVINLARANRNKKDSVNDLDVAFERRLTKFNNPDYVGPVRRETVAALNLRRESFKRRQSKLNQNPDLMYNDYPGSFSNSTFENDYQ